MLTTGSSAIDELDRATDASPVAGSDERTDAMAAEWASLVEQIQRGSEEAMEQLYKLFLHGVRFYFCRQLGPQELDDKVHDAFVIVVQAIQHGDLREPERLMGFVRTIVRRQVAAHIDSAIQTRREMADMEPGMVLVDSKRNPEEKAIRQQNAAIMAQVLNGMSARDREILTRFYLNEQPQEQICSEMKLSETQFRLLKSRAKARFGELGRRKLQKKPSATFSKRTFLRFLH